MKQLFKNKRRGSIRYGYDPTLRNLTVCVFILVVINCIIVFKYNLDIAKLSIDYKKTVIRNDNNVQINKLFSDVLNGKKDLLLGEGVIQCTYKQNGVLQDVPSEKLVVLNNGN